MNSSFLFVISTVLIVSSYVNICLCANSPPKVEISNGILKGISSKSRGGNTYSAFLGIPYAKPPKRFKVAESPEDWQGVRDATQFGDICMQKSLLNPEEKVRGSEDCLFINVYTAIKKTPGMLPVMVYIHGGAFMSGTSDEYGPDYFMDEDVILVTFNYRLGALGFLSTGDRATEANLGLKDQVLALKWVQKNIKAFGGDIGKVTLFGESAGAVSVHHHILSPLSKGLFSQAIIQSGSALNSWAYTKNPAKRVFALGQALGCNIETSSKLMECLNKMSAHDIIKQDMNEWYMDPVVVFFPSKDVDGSEQIFIADDPINTLKAGNFNKVPVIFTACEDEGILVHSAAVTKTEIMRKEINEDFLKVFPITFIYDNEGYTKTQLNWLSRRIKKFYFGKREIGEKTFKNLTNLYTDRLFIHGIEKALPYHAQSVPVYNAIFGYKGDVSVTVAMGFPEVLGVTHGDDLLYLFNINAHGVPKIALNGRDETASKILVKMWVSFASTGKPVHESLDTPWDPLDSPKLDKNGPTWFYLNYPTEVLENPLKERMQFWDQVLEKAKSISDKEEL